MKKLIFLIPLLFLTACAGLHQTAGPPGSPPSGWTNSADGPYVGDPITGYPAFGYNSTDGVYFDAGTPDGSFEFQIDPTTGAVFIGSSDAIVSQSNCATITEGVCIDSADHQIYRWDGDSVENISGAGTDEIIYQADCSGITNGICYDTDNGTFYYWDGDSVASVGATHAAVTLAAGVNALTLSTQEIGIDTLVEQLADLTPTNNALLGFSAGGALVNVESLTLDVQLAVQESTTAGELGRTAADLLTMGDNAGAATLYFAPLLDTATDGDTAKVWSADKVFDLLAAKQAALTGSESLTFTNKTMSTAGTGNDITVPLNGLLDGSITDPADADDLIYKKSQFAVTITDIYCQATGGGTITLTLQECDDATCASPSTIEGAITCDADGAEDDGTLTDGAGAAGAWYKVLFSAPSGTVTSLAWSVSGTQVW